MTPLASRVQVKSSQNTEPMQDSSMQHMEILRLNIFILWKYIYGKITFVKLNG